MSILWIDLISEFSCAQRCVMMGSFSRCCCGRPQRWRDQHWYIAGEDAPHDIRVRQRSKPRTWPGPTWQHAPWHSVPTPPERGVGTGVPTVCGVGSQPLATPTLPAGVLRSALNCQCGMSCASSRRRWTVQSIRFPSTEEPGGGGQRVRLPKIPCFSWGHKTCA